MLLFEVQCYFIWSLHNIYECLLPPDNKPDIIVYKVALKTQQTSPILISSLATSLCLKLCLLSSFLFCTAGFQGEMECSKRHAYLTQFYRTVVDNLLPTKRREREEEGGGKVLVLDLWWETRRCYGYSSLSFSRPGILTQPHSTWNCPTQDSWNIRLCKGGTQPM